MDKEIKKIMGGPDLEEEIEVLERRLKMLHDELTKEEEKKSLKSLQSKLDQLRSQFMRWAEDKETVHQIVRDYRGAKKITGSLAEQNREAYELLNKLESLNAKADVYTEKAASAVLYKLAPELNAMRKDFSDIQTHMNEVEDKFSAMRKQEREHLTSMKAAVDEQIDSLTVKGNEIKEKSKVTLEEIKTEAYKQVADLEDIGRTLDENNDSTISKIKEEMKKLQEEIVKTGENIDQRNQEALEKITAHAETEFDRIKALQDQEKADVSALIDDKLGRIDKRLDTQIAILNDRIKEEDDRNRGALVKRFEMLEDTVTTETSRFRERLDKSLDDMNRSLDEMGERVVENSQLLKQEVKENIPYQFIEVTDRLTGLEPLVADMEKLKTDLETNKKVSDKIANILSQLKAENSLVAVADMGSRLDKVEKMVNQKAPGLEKRLGSLEDKVSLLDVDRILALIEKLSTLKKGLADAGEKIAGGGLPAKVEALEAKIEELDAKAQRVDEFQKTAAQLDGALSTVRDQIVDIKDIIVKGKSS